MARKAGSHSEITGPLVRDAAQRLFARHGYAAVSMRQIAAQVGVQAGALYTYTPNKQALLYDIMKTHLDEVLAGWRAMPKGDRPRDALEAFARFHVRFHFDRPDTMFIANMELRNLSPENFRRIEALRADYEAELGGVLAAGQAAGEFHLPDLRLATMAVLAMLTGVTTWYRDDGRLSRRQVEDTYWEMVRQAVGA